MLRHQAERIGRGVGTGGGAEKGQAGEPAHERPQQAHEDDSWEKASRGVGPVTRP